MGKYLEALKLLYVENELNSELPEARTDNTDISPFVSSVSFTSGNTEIFQPPIEQESIPFSDHEIAEHKIDQLKQHDDRVFVRRCLLGVFKPFGNGGRILKSMAARE
jgi:hypothetical protein